MNRLTRTAAAVALSAATLVAFAPAAQALSRKPSAVHVVNGNWMDAALTWLSQLFEAPQKPSRTSQKLTEAPRDWPGFDWRQMTGSCIDPNGCTIDGGGN